MTETSLHPPIHTPITRMAGKTAAGNSDATAATAAAALAAQVAATTT